MFRDEKLELKVGLFIGIGIFIMFLIVFTVQDFSMLGKWYDIKVVFSYVNGLTENSPVRYAGVGIGEVRDIEMFFDEESQMTRVRVHARIKGDVKIEDDALPRINSLGLLGEQYLEITPGTSKTYISQGATVLGRDPVHVGRQMDRFNEMVGYLSEIVRAIRDGRGTVGKLVNDDTLYMNLTNITSGLKDGKGTLGKLIEDDSLYNDIETIVERLKNGEGTIGKLLAEDDVYQNMKDLSSDVKANPWKLIYKSKETKPSDRERSADGKASNFGPR